MIYLDTSLLLKLYAHEHGSEQLAAWLIGKSTWCCARHGRLELVSALKRHQREGRISPQGIRQALARLDADEKTQLIEWLSVSDELIDSACTTFVALPPTVFLRAADALHLACAKAAGLKEIYSHDDHLLAAAPHFKLKGVDVLKAH